MDNFLAAVLTEHYKPLTIESFKAEPAGKGQVLVEMITAGLCGAQINEIDAVKGQDKYMPHFMGHEGFGVVRGIGEGVTRVKPGDYVVLHWKKGEGCDCFGGKYFSKLGIVGSGPVTTFAEQTIVSENRVTAVDYKPSLKNLYPLIGCALSTSYGIVREFRKTDKVIIAGAGGLGLTIAFWLKVFFNMKPIMIDKFENKREMAEAFDAEFYSLEKTPDVYDIIGKANHCIDTTGNVNSISKLFSKADKGGSLILVGQPRVGEKLVLDNALSIFDGIKIYSSDGGNFNPDRDLKSIAFYVDRHSELASKLITHVIGLEEINEGFAKMREGEAGRIIINFKGSK